MAASGAKRSQKDYKRGPKGVSVKERNRRQQRRSDPQGKRKAPGQRRNNDGRKQHNNGDKEEHWTERSSTASERAAAPERVAANQPDSHREHHSKDKDGEQEDERGRHGDGGGGGDGGRGGLQEPGQEPCEEEITILYTNTQSLPSKIAELEAVASDLGPELILLRETWCNENIASAALTINGYEIQLREDRNDTANGIGGGLIVYSRNRLEILPCDQSSNFNQYCKFSMKRGGEMYYFYLIYRPPSSGQENFDLLCELVDNAEKNSIMVGDFNLHNIDWSSGEARGREAKFVTVLQDNYMEQLVDFKTHIKGNCLDLLITNIPGKVKEVCEMGRLGKSDHIIMQISLALAEQRESKPVVTKNWKRADWQKVRAGLSETIWPRTDDDLSAQEAWRKLRDTLDTLEEENAGLGIRIFNCTGGVNRF